MAQQMDSLTARRIALGAQGFTNARPSGRPDVRHFRKVMRSVGALQVDSVNVLERSHYLPVFSRLGDYPRQALDRYANESGELFEYWGHAASLLRIEDYPLFRWRMASMRPWSRVEKLRANHPGYVDLVADEIRVRGPLTVSDLEDGGDRTGPWWGYSDGKIALEWLFATGRITARRDARFMRVYDLAERAIPPDVYDAPAPDRDEAYRELLLRSAAHLGVGTAADLVDYFRLHGPTARPVLSDLAAAGLLSEISVDGWRDPAYVLPDAVRPRQLRGTALLSPFDSLVWNRDRTERIFGFHYRIEIYVPAAKRVFGYYVLPFLLDGDLVGRVDLKAHRGEGVLEVRAAHHELDADPARVAAALWGELDTMRGWLGLDDIACGSSGNLMSRLRKVSS